jgi:small subunit ribosomal protein S16
LPTRSSFISPTISGEKWDHRFSGGFVVSLAFAGSIPLSDSIYLKEFVLAVKIRLARHGAKKAPYYRVVVADARSPRDGRFIEEVGRYNPCAEPAYVKLDLEKIDTWIKNGAQATEPVSKLVAKAREEA